MADNAIIAVNDGESTPVTHSFSPKGIYGEIAKYQNLATSFLEGRETLTVSLKDGGKVQRGETVLHLPRVLDETVNGVTVSRVADFATIRITGLFPPTWEEQDRKNGRVMASNLLLNAIVAAAFDNGEFVY
jgi:hypothetical protein